MDTATNIWNELKHRFYQGDVFKISNVQEEFNLKLGDSYIFFDYTKLKKLWQELDNFCLIVECSCDTTRHVVTKIRAYRDGDQVIIFLRGLIDQYSPMRSQIVPMEPLSTICRVYSLLVQQEIQTILPISGSKVFVFPNLNQP